MLAFLEGSLAWVGDETVWLEVRGIGYEIHMHPNFLAALPTGGTNLRIYTHLDVQEKDLRLFGFMNPEQLRQFKILLGVSGVGTKLSQTITAELSLEELHQAILLQDEKKLMTIPGIGKKMASRLIFELKDKLAALPIEVATAGPEQKLRGEAFEALEVLGYSRSEVLPLWLELQEKNELTDKTDVNLKLLLRRLAQSLKR